MNIVGPEKPPGPVQKSRLRTNRLKLEAMVSYGLAVADFLLVLILVSEGPIMRERSTLRVVGWTYVGDFLLELGLLLVGVRMLLHGLAIQGVGASWLGMAKRTCTAGVIICIVSASLAIAMLAVH